MSDSRDHDQARLHAALAATRPAEPSQSHRWSKALVLAFYAGDLALARRILREACDDIPAVTVLDEVLAPAMHYIGELWERNEITIADEHLATAIAHRLLAEVANGLQVAPPETRETILLATPAHERHTMGLLMANDVLHGAGYHTVQLGAGVPDCALSAALDRHRPAVVALSATMVFPDGLTGAITTVHETLPGVQIVIGGAAARAVRPHTELPPHAETHHIERLSGLVETVDAVLARRR